MFGLMPGKLYNNAATDEDFTKLYHDLHVIGKDTLPLMQFTGP